MDIPAAIALSSKSEEVLVGIQNLYLDDRIASSRAVDNSVFVEFSNFEALEEIEPSSAVPHIAIGSDNKEPHDSQSVDLIEDYKDELPADLGDKPVRGMASSPPQPKTTMAPANSLAAGCPISGRVATYLAATKANTRASSFQQPQDNTLELLGDEASNKVSNLMSYYTPQPANIKKFGIRRVAIKAGDSIHFTSEHALLQAAQRFNRPASQPAQEDAIHRASPVPTPGIASSQAGGATEQFKIDDEEMHLIVPDTQTIAHRRCWTKTTGRPTSPCLLITQTSL